MLDKDRPKYNVRLIDQNIMLDRPKYNVRL